MTLWNLAETAGVKPKYIKIISKEIQELLIEKGYDKLIYKENIN